MFQAHRYKNAGIQVLNKPIIFYSPFQINYPCHRLKR